MIHNAEELERLAAAWIRSAGIAFDPAWSGVLDLHVVIEAGVIQAESGVRLLRDEGRSGS